MSSSGNATIFWEIILHYFHINSQPKHEDKQCNIGKKYLPTQYHPKEQNDENVPKEQHYSWNTKVHTDMKLET